MIRRSAPLVIAAALALAACTGSDDPRDTVDTTEVSVPTSDDLDLGSGDECITHDELLFVDLQFAEAVAGAGIGASERVEPGQLARFLGLEGDDNVEQNLNTMLNSVAVFRSDEPSAAIREINAEFKNSAEEPDVASPVHAVGFVGHWRFAPALPAQPLGSEMGADAFSTDETDKRIIVIDTGYVEAEIEPLKSRVSPLTVGLDDEPAGLAPQLAGHGMFVASVILQAVAADVTVVSLRPTTSAMMDHGTSTDFTDVLSDELQLLYAMARVVNGVKAGEAEYVLNLSAGTYACSDTDAQGIRRAVDLWNDSGLGGPIVAAAGNDGRKDCTFLPAGFDDVIGVGAVDTSGTRANFSNNSDVVALGVDVEGVAPGQAAGPFVRWSGTSFAAPAAAAATALGRPVDKAPGDTQCQP